MTIFRFSVTSLILLAVVVASYLMLAYLREVRRGGETGHRIAELCGFRAGEVSYISNLKGQELSMPCYLTMCPSAELRPLLSCVRKEARKRGYAIRQEMCIGECQGLTVE